MGSPFSGKVTINKKYFSKHLNLEQCEVLTFVKNGNIGRSKKDEIGTKYDENWSNSGQKFQLSFYQANL